MLDQIFIKDFQVKACVGIYEDERKNTQILIVNAVLFCDASEAAKKDDLKLGVDYEAIYLKILEYFSSQKPYTLERAALDLCEICFCFEKVSEASITLEKPYKFSQVGSVGVKIHRKKFHTS